MNKKSFAHISDAELLEKFYATHDNQWLGILLPRYTLLLLGVCMKYLKNEEDAKDGVQQIFLKAIAELHKYKVVYIKSWLYMIARNHCLMHLRNKNSKIPLALDDTMQPTAEEPEMQKEVILQLIETALPQLRRAQQSCIRLFYLEKQSYQQISDKTGFSIMQIKSHIQNGKRNLKLLVEKQMNHSEHAQY